MIVLQSVNPKLRYVSFQWFEAMRQRVRQQIAQMGLFRLQHLSQPIRCPRQTFQMRVAKRAAVGNLDRR